MGLDTSHNCWHGSYGGFTNFRHAVARAAGYAVWPVLIDPKTPGYARDTIMVDWGHVTPDNLQGEWESPPADPLMVFIAHSDCDGVIYPQHAGPLADRMEALLQKIKDYTGHGAGADYYRQRARQFIDGLRRAVAAGEVVAFH